MRKANWAIIVLVVLALIGTGLLLVVPGNHDIPAYNLLIRFTDPFRRYRRYVSGELSPLYRDEAAARALVSKHQNQAILNRIASARLGWNPRLYNPRLERWLHRVKAPRFSDRPRWHCGSCARKDAKGRYNRPPVKCQCLKTNCQLNCRALKVSTCNLREPRHSAQLPTG